MDNILREVADKLSAPEREHAIAMYDWFSAHNPKLSSAAVFHDMVEDGYITLEELRNRGWESETIETIDALTRRKDEQYFDYIRRLKLDSDAAEIKLVDIAHNLTRCNDSLRARYIKALGILLGTDDETK